MLDIIKTSFFIYYYHKRTSRTQKNIKEAFNMKEKLLGLIQDEKGQAMTEYGLIIALVAIVVIGALGLIGTNINTKFTTIKDELAK